LRFERRRAKPASPLTGIAGDAESAGLFVF
jgi:hypothetical protein